MALKSDSTVWSWGYNNFGQLGSGVFAIYLVPVQTISLTNIISIAAGGFHSLALRDDGTLTAWGRNYYGQFGNSSNNDSNVPTAVTSFTNCIAIAAGSNHSLAMKNDGSLWAWGYNFYGQLGIGSGSDINFPIQVWGPCNTSASINDSEVKENSFIYPKPSNGIFEVRSPDYVSGRVEIFNVLGEQVFASDFSGLMSVNLSTQPKGMYFVRVVYPDGKTGTGKAIIE